ncbi:MAG: yjcR [Akkermansiaceae bacterium]|nr:yjcR [Akkermansiaceae bacterium]
MNPEPDASSTTGLEPRPAPKLAPANMIRKILGRIIGLAAILSALVLGAKVASQTGANPQSRDGVIRANVIGIAPRVSGPILRLHVINDQIVKKGDVLFEIDPEPFEWAVKSARANIDAADGELINSKTGIEAQISQAKSAEASLEKAKTSLQQATDSYNRMEPLAKDRYVSAETLDSARSARDTAAAAVRMGESEVAAAHSAVKNDAPLWAKRRAAEASLGQAELAVRDCRVVAPFDGRVVGLGISEGAFATAGLTVITLIDMGDWHVEANFLENDLHRLKPGTKVRLEIMTDAATTYVGRVESVSSGVALSPEPPSARASLPVVQRELDWVRLAQRFPVRIRIEPPPPDEVLRIGTVVTATVESER